MRTCNGAIAVPSAFHVSVANFHVPARRAGVASGFNPHHHHVRGKLSVGMCVNSAVHTTFDKGMHVIGCRHHKCKGCIIVHRRGKLRAMCNRLSGRVISRGRCMRTKRPVKLNKGAKHSAKSRLRFRAHFLKRTVGPTLLFSFRGRSVMTSSCLFEGNGGECRHGEAGDGGIGLLTSSSNAVHCRGMEDKSALDHVTRGANASVSTLYGLGRVAHEAVLHPKRILEYSWTLIGWRVWGETKGDVLFHLFICTWTRGYMALPPGREI